MMVCVKNFLIHSHSVADLRRRYLCTSKSSRSSVRPTRCTIIETGALL